MLWCALALTALMTATTPRATSVGCQPRSPAPLTTAYSEEKLQRYLVAISDKLDTRAQKILPRITGTGQRLLAVRGYLRNAASLDMRWTWSPVEINRYKASPEYRAAIAEVEKVKRIFAAQNSGYTLFANTEVRSLDEQIANWNKTPSIKTAGDALLSDTLKELSDAVYKDMPDALGTTRFTRFLQSARLAQTPTIATPGLSPHGQLRAFDFVVKKGGTLIAGAVSAAIKSDWDDAGWTQKLNQAIKQSGPHFTGPLSAPREPWHYTYVP